MSALIKIIRDYIISKVATQERGSILTDATNAVVQDITENGLNADDMAIIDALLAEPADPAA